MYEDILNFLRERGKHLSTRELVDIGVTKKFLTEEDTNIEREIKELISKNYPNSTFWAEEENYDLIESNDLWICDPISGTRHLLAGRKTYTLTIARLVNHEIVFGAVYQPCEDKLYYAIKGEGAFCNDKKLQLNPKNPTRIAITSAWTEPDKADKLTKQFELFEGSHALIFCKVAEGEFGGACSLSKDTFPIYAAAIIVREAGGKFTSINGGLNPEDRIFIAGNDDNYEKIKKELLLVL